MPKQNVLTIRQITEHLQKYQDSLAQKIDSSQVSYEKFSTELSLIESELEKKQKEKFSKMKACAQEFIVN